MSTVYLAGQYARRAELISYIPLFERAGFEVTSRWLTTRQHADLLAITQEEYDADPFADRANDMDDEQQRSIAEMDLEDVARAQAFVMFSEEPGGLWRGGRLIEYGYALGLGKEVVICGPRESFFFMLDRPNIVQVDTPEQAAQHLRAWANLSRFVPPEPVYHYSTEHGLRPAVHGWLS